MLQEGCKTSLPASVPIIDIAICHELGLTEQQVADALLGKDQKTLGRIIDVMKERGEIEYGLNGKST